MMKFFFKKTILATVFILLIQQVYAGNPLWTITPLTKTTVSVASDGSADISYLVKNTSKRVHTLVMTPILGVVQNTSPAFCPGVFVLYPNQSCVLSLTAQGPNLPNNPIGGPSVLGGPVICQGGNALQCYQPAPNDRLKLTKGFMVSFSITGLTETLTLLINGANPLTISSDGFFTFDNLFPDGSTYSITIGSASPGETCTIENGTGVINGASVTTPSIICSPQAFTVGGMVSGLVGNVVLTNLGERITVSANGAFNFPTPIAEGASYDVRVLSASGTQTCSVSDGTGVMGPAPVTNVQIVCAATAFTVGGQVSNLAGTVTLLLNGQIPVTVSTVGPFTFPRALANGTPYSVSVAQNPAQQTCSVTNGTGTITNANVTNVSVNCLFDVTTLRVTSTLPLVIPVVPNVPTFTASITVQNTGLSTAQNVRARFPSAWTDVIQDASACLLLAPGASCQINVGSTIGFVAAPLKVNGSDSPTIIASNVQQRVALPTGFSFNNYLIWGVEDTSYLVIDNVNVGVVGQAWSIPSVIPTNAVSTVNGPGNTSLITFTPGIFVSAASFCFNSTNGGALAGTWFLPAICQMGGNRQGAGCVQGLDNFNSNLIVPGFGVMLGLIPSPPPVPLQPPFFHFWSSTETSFETAWAEFYSTNGTSPQISTNKALTNNNGPYLARCARLITP